MNSLLCFFINLGGTNPNYAHTNLYCFLPILEYALAKLNVLPKRNFDSVDEFLDFFKVNKNLLIDATERIRHRKKEYQEQKKYYNDEAV